MSLLRRVGRVWLPLGHLPGARPAVRRLALAELDERLLNDLGLSRGELRDALRSGREPRRGY